MYTATPVLSDWGGFVILEADLTLSEHRICHSC